MPTYFVRQPNGLFGRFSTIVDAFCEVDMSHQDAKRWCREQGMTTTEAAERVRRAVDDEPAGGPTVPRCCDQKLTRWHDALSVILHCHGTAGLATFLAKYPSTYAPKPVGKREPSPPAGGG